ncbi:MAG: macro domain-containing protein [Propionibacteriaceae bacterium]|nr:macro domain-containing protein [Propionibacteriaceae bacterium]
MKTRVGDLIELALGGEFDVIVHGCNCYCTMGGGIARAIRARLPEAYEADCATEAGDLSKLGSYTSAEIVRDGVRFTVVNAYTQGGYSGSGRLADYDAIRKVFKAIAAAYPRARIGYPKIGAGLAGGDWDTISAIIDEELAGCDHTLVVLPG